MKNNYPLCENCSKCLELEVYKADDKNNEIREVLDKYNLNKVCLAFNHKNIAHIGRFDGIGCESFEDRKQ